jgi:hypothetical protein
MGGVIKAGLSTVQAPNGGGLAIYVDSLTGEVMLKDISGNIEPLSNFIRAYTETTGKSEFYLIEEQDCIKPVSGNNSLLGKNSVILSGEYNINRGEFSVINGGKGNTVDADFGIIVGGNANNVNGRLSSVLAGENNNTNTHTNTHIIGSNIVADRDDTTFIENLSITNLPTSSKGLPKNSIWNNKGVLSIV